MGVVERGKSWCWSLHPPSCWLQSTTACRRGREEPRRPRPDCRWRQRWVDDGVGVRCIHCLGAPCAYARLAFRARAWLQGRVVGGRLQGSAARPRWLCSHEEGRRAGRRQVGRALSRCGLALRARARPWKAGGGAGRGQGPAGRRRPTELVRRRRPPTAPRWAEGSGTGRSRLRKEEGEAAGLPWRPRRRTRGARRPAGEEGGRTISLIPC